MLREQITVLHRRLLAIVRDDEVCRRLMTVPGVGPVVALTYRATVDVPARFRNSKAVGAVLELTPSTYSIGRDQPHRCDIAVWRRDDASDALRSSRILLVRSTQWSWLKAWAMKIARHRGIKKAIVALARRLAVVVHRIWVDGTKYGGPGRSQRHENHTGSNPIGGNASSTARWHDVPRGTMDVARSYVRLDLSFI